MFGPALVVAVLLAASVAGPGHAQLQQGRARDCVTPSGFLGDCRNGGCPGPGGLSRLCAVGQTCCIRLTPARPEVSEVNRPPPRLTPARPEVSEVNRPPPRLTPARPQVSEVNRPPPRLTPARPQVSRVNRPPPHRPGTAAPARRRPTLLNPQFECGGQPAPDTATEAATEATTRDPSAIVFLDRFRRAAKDLSLAPSPGLPTDRPGSDDLSVAGGAPEPETGTAGVGLITISANLPEPQLLSLQDVFDRIESQPPFPDHSPNSIDPPTPDFPAGRRHRRSPQTAEEREGFESVWQEYQDRVRSGAAAPGFTRAQLLEAYRAAAKDAEQNAAASPSGGGGWVCGAVLISERYMLTAAHCLGAGRPQVVRLGDRNLTTTEDGAPQDYRVQDVIQHPEYRHPLVYHDLALLKLDRTVQFSEHVRPFCLYDGSASLTGKVSHVSGWGATEFGGDLSQILLGGNLTIWDRQRCDDVFSQQSGFKRRLSDGITPGLICAGGEEQDACQGDSGGPMTVVTERGTRLVGVVSSGVGCASPGIPGIYTNVASYIDWIDGIVYGGQTA